MDEILIKFYRKMLREGFEHAGSLENPTVFLNTIGEKIRICGSSTNHFLKIYMDISDGRINDIKYLCTCDPTANVVIEILCSLVTGKTIAEAEALTEDDFVRVLGSRGEDFVKRAGDSIKLLKRGLDRYKAGIPPVLD